ncbi:winged-helix domain-containing protein [Pseudomonas sp. NPDC090592]|uniref:winged helix-turn-helix transcriptional regulator n=1 Tax=Pseudomonas sp. NPDC090592 TaxID=3364480 RepID=UPI003839F66F
MTLEPGRRCVRALLVSDDASFAGWFVARIEAGGVHMEWVREKENLVGRLEVFEPDMIVLDRPSEGAGELPMLANCDRFPTLLLTNSKIHCDAHHTDFIPRRSDPDLVIARMHAMLQRTSHGCAPVQEQLIIGDLVLDPLERFVTWRGANVELPTTEMRVLEVLMRFAGETLSREELSQRVRGRALNPDDRSIDVAVSKLRGKFDDPAYGSRKIKTIWGKGYALNPSAWQH